MTKAEQQALEWLRERGGDAAIARTKAGGNQIMAQGEVAPFMRSTWNSLANQGLLEFYGGAKHGGKGSGRLRLI
jgi:hypothetical protein